MGAGGGGGGAAGKVLRGGMRWKQQAAAPYPILRTVETGMGRVLLKGWGGGGLGGEGGLEPKSPKVCVPKIAQINIFFCKFHCFPL